MSAQEGCIVRVKIIANSLVQLRQKLLERCVGILFAERTVGSRGVAVPNIDEDIIQRLACLDVPTASRVSYQSTEKSFDYKRREERITV